MVPKKRSSDKNSEKVLTEKDRELSRITREFEKMRDEWEIRLQYSRRGLEVTNRELAKRNFEMDRLNRELAQLKDTLEKKVMERTKELEDSKSVLQDRVNDLEKFHRLTVGRELKMSELKNEIRFLKEEIKRLNSTEKSSMDEVISPE